VPPVSNTSNRRLRKLSKRLVSWGLASAVLVVPFDRTSSDEDPGVYRALFDQARDARFVLDPEGQILHANPAAAHLFGASEGALRGVAFTELLDAEARPTFQAILVATQTPAARAGPIPLKARSAKGTPFQIEVDVVHGTKERYGVVARDVRAVRPPPAGRFNPGQMLIASRIQELV
jgi:PAS domain S-box-containing protein